MSANAVNVLIVRKNEGPLPKMLNSPADGIRAGGLESLPGPSP